MTLNWGQVITAMVTPFTPSGEVDYARAGQLAEKLVENGSDGLVVCGTTGESPTLTKEEKLRLFATVVERVGGKAAVIAGTGSYNTAESIAFTQEAEKTGVDGILLVNPYYNKPSQEGLYQHFAAIARSTTLPVMLYNIPGRTSVNCLPETVARLAEIENIVAVKEASGDLAQIAEVKRRVPSDFLLYSGDDALTLPILAVGGVGVVSVASHLVGREIGEMIAHFKAGRVREATALHLRLLPLFKALFILTNPVPLKAALAAVGWPVGGVRLPLVEAGPKETELIRGELSRLGLLG
ncbi:MAG TPA: 4-hydroxy-tetrahydrodipicolinate synthase [Firmicutes bacterium]|nr:4-hydroxy-tetrahydrodipicolinate synthase [Bacillota bacterium]